MRNTLNIDDDLRLAVKEGACRDAQSIAAVASRLFRQALAGDREAGSGAAGPAPEFGFRPFPKHGGLVTNELIDQLREETEG